ncbi:MAG: ribosome-associated translation inhibitor RaiA [Candidatus Omnitrophica bacterium]|nr:ribosome-associated translation inhibitor RaiA [Candidatus Omnitrophota bacterium]
MDIRFSGMKMTVTQGMQSHFKDKILRLDKYAPKIVESHIVLKKQKYGFEAEIILLSKNFRACGQGKDKENVYTAIDQAYDRVEKQLKRHREKEKSHHAGGSEVKVPKVRTAKEMNTLSRAERASGQPMIIPSDEFSVKPMDVEEASMQLELSRKSFIVFSNASTKKVNVLYKLSDGNHGLVEPKK